MIVPQYWAESRRQHRAAGRQITVRRFGWSDTSEQDAQANADARADEALSHALAGENVRPREPKLPYNGAEGVPIREEIVSLHGETIITRNAYGARCLNTPNVLFADVDFPQALPLSFTLGLLAVMLALALAAGTAYSSGLGIALAVVSGLFVFWMTKKGFAVMQRLRGGPAHAVEKQIEHFIQTHPGWGVRCYRTPAGLRLLATHQTFDPADPQVGEFFRAVGADPVYQAMCQNQQCFRARVSAKPWRIGISAHMKPRPGVWPIALAHQAARDAWVRQYEAVAEGFAACAFGGSLGNPNIHPAVRAVMDLHDELCRATRSLPLA